MLFFQIVTGGKFVQDAKEKYPDFFASTGCTAEGEEIEQLPILIGVCIDGLNPFNSGTYSLWSFVVECFNICPEVRLTLHP